MVAPTKRGQRGIAAAIGMMGIMVALGCVHSGAPVTSTESAPSAELVEAAVLTDVRVEQHGDVSVVTLVGVPDAIYTAFERSEPRAIVLDLAGVQLGVNSEPMPVFDGVIQQVALIPSGALGANPATRVEIELGTDADFDVRQTSEGLVVSIMPPQLEARSAAEVDPWSDDSAPVEESSAMLESMEPEAAPLVMQSASTLRSVDVTTTEGGTLMSIVADGVIESTSTFTLEDPARLVVDLMGLASEASASKIEVGSDQVERIRIGAHPDKVRIVVDGGAGAGSFEGRRLMPVASGMLITVGSGEALAEALAAAQASSAVMAATPIESAPTESSPMEALEAEAPVAEMAASEEPEMGLEGIDEPAMPEVEQSDAPTIQIYGVHYDSQADRERVVVLADATLDYTLHTPDSDTVVISIPGAVIAPEAEGRIAPRAGGPISLIRAFAQPDVDRPEVRLVVTRAKDLEPELTQQGSLLFVDFPQEGVAPAPPAFVDTTLAESDVEAGDSSMGDAMAALEALELAEAASAEAGGELAVVELPNQPAPASIGDPYVDDSTIALPNSQAEAAETVSAVMATPVAAPASLEPPAAVEILQEGGLIDGKQYSGRRISLDFKDVEVADVLRLIAEVSDLNVISGDEVKGQVTIRMVDVPWDQALDVILLTKGLGFVRVGNVLRIAPSDVLKDEEELRLQERRAKEKLEDLMVRLVPVNYATVKDMEALVKRLLTSRGTVNTDERTNTLIIKDIESVIEEAVALVKAVDTQTPQVVIEAKIVEAALDFSRDLGIAWGLGANTLDGDGFGQSPRPRDDLGGPDFRWVGANSVSSSNLVAASQGFFGTLGALVLDEQLKIDLVVQAAESNGSGKVISSPRVVTLDNREASIEQGVSIPFQTFESGDAKLEFIDAVLSLNVTPHITADEAIIMDIEVTRNAPDDSVATPTGSPAIARNEAHTEALVRDSQTLVIGGIYTITRSERSSRVPYLHRIPVIGLMFKNKSVTDSRKELLIFVTPRIIQNSGADVT
jgi:type IV pilus assembly protein PilQ